MSDWKKLSSAFDAAAKNGSLDLSGALTPAVTGRACIEFASPDHAWFVLDSAYRQQIAMEFCEDRANEIAEILQDSDRLNGESSRGFCDRIGGQIFDLWVAYRDHRTREMRARGLIADHCAMEADGFEMGSHERPTRFDDQERDAI